jgi:hypothetical protein
LGVWKDTNADRRGTGSEVGFADVKKIDFNWYLKNTLYTVNIQGLEPILCLVRELQVFGAHRPA